MTWSPSELVAAVASRVQLGRSYVLLAGETPPRRTVDPAMLVIADGDADYPSVGPGLFDTAPLRRWLRCAAKGGLVALFAGDRDHNASAALTVASLAIPSGTVLVNCRDDRFVEWDAFLALHAEGAARYVSVPAAMLAAAKTRAQAEALHAATWKRWDRR
jgi:hypothetical protein